MAREPVRSRRSRTGSNGGKADRDRLRREARRIHDLGEARPPLPRLGEGRQGRPARRAEHGHVHVPQRPRQPRRDRLLLLHATSRSVPSGANKPTVAGGAGKAGPGDWFPVVFDDDAFSDKSVIDMSKLVEAPAGKHGFLKRVGSRPEVREGRRRRSSSGAAARTCRAGQFNREQLTQRARYLRKHGVNMVRQHPVLEELGPLVGRQARPQDARRLGLVVRRAEEARHLHDLVGLLRPPDRPRPTATTRSCSTSWTSSTPAKNLRNTYGLVNVEPKLQDLQLRLPQGPARPQEPVHRPAARRRPGAGGGRVPERGLRLLPHARSAASPADKWPQHCPAAPAEVLRLGEGRSTATEAAPEARLGRPARRRLVRQGRAGADGRLAPRRGRPARTNSPGQTAPRRRLHPLPHRPPARVLRAPREGAARARVQGRHRHHRLAHRRARRPTRPTSTATPPPT